MSLAMIISLGAAGVSLATFIFNIMVSHKNSVIERAGFFKEIIEKLRFDDDLVAAMTIMDYDEEWYTPAFGQSAIEVKIDKLLAYLSYICYLQKVKVITQREFMLCEYKIRRTCQNKNTYYYLKFINRFALQNGIKHSYIDLIDYLKAKVLNNDPAQIEEFEHGTDFLLPSNYVELNIIPPAGQPTNK